MAGRTRSIALVAATVLVSLAFHAAFAATTTSRGSTPSQIKVLRSRPSQSFSTTADTFANVPGARMKVRIPGGTRGLVVVRFTGQAGCDSNVANAYCSVRVFVGGKQAQPKTKGVDYVFADSRAGGLFGSYSVERSRGGLSPGTYTVRVQWRSTGGAEFTLQNWHLTAEVYRQ